MQAAGVSLDARRKSELWPAVVLFLHDPFVVRRRERAPELRHSVSPSEEVTW
jgi:hypothetical protein